MVEILPAILEKTKTAVEEKVFAVYELVDRVQIDIVDESFGEPTVKPDELGGVAAMVDIDYHLMVNEPKDWLDKIAVDEYTMVYGQVEKMSNISEFIAHGQQLGFWIGLALDIETPVEVIKPYVEEIDGLLLMSVKAGMQGQQFDTRVIHKIEDARALRHNLKLVVDGGIGVAEIKKCISAEWAVEMSKGEWERDLVDIAFAVGSELFSAPDLKKKLKNLQMLREEENV